MATKNTSKNTAPAETEQVPAAPEQDTAAAPADTITAAAPAVIAAAAKAWQNVGKADTAAAKAVTRTKAEQLPATLDAWQAFGLALKPLVAAWGETFDDVSGTGLFRAIGKGLLPADQRAAFPTNATAYSKALTLARFDTAARRSAFGKTGNAPDSDEYVVWLTLTETGKAGSNRSTIDVKASLVDPAKDWDETTNTAKPGARFGTLVRGGGARGIPGSGMSKVPDAIAKVLKNRDDRAKLSAVPIVAALNIPAESWDGFVAQVIAQYLLQQVPATADGAPAITVEVATA